MKKLIWTRKGFKLDASSVFKKMLAASSLLAFSHSAFALKASDLTSAWESEGAAIAPVMLFLIAIVGVIFAALAVISAISTKKQDRPLTWQVWGIVGGATAVVIPVIILAVSGSLTGEEGNAGGMMDSMNLNY